MTETRHYIDALKDRFATHANPGNAAQMSRYMKNRFPFFGIKAPERKALVAAQVRELGRPEDWAALGYGLWEEEMRELQYAFNDLLEPVVKRQSQDLMTVLEALIQSRSWWDTVDFLAPRLAGRLLKQFPDLLVEYPDRWIDHPNFWLQRSAIIFQLNWKTDTDENRLFRYIRCRADSNEFFVRKAAGWALRQYARCSPEEVRQFVAGTPLHSLTVREALKRIGSN